MVSLTIVKFCSVITLLTLNSLSGLVSFYFSERISKNPGSRVWRYLFSLSNCFSVGLFLGISLLGLYRNADARIQDVQHHLVENNMWGVYPLSELILCISLFFLCASEWSLRFGFSFIESYSKKKRSSHQTFSEASIKLLDVQSNSEDDAVDTHLISQSNGNSIKLRNRKQLRSSVKSDDGFSFLKSLFILYAMSFHSILEAISFGLLESINQIISMSAAMALHQTLCAGTLGFRLAHSSTTRTSRYLALGVLFVYLLILPSGAFLGTYLHVKSEPLSSFNSSLACSPLNTTCSNGSLHSTTDGTQYFSWNMTLATLQILAAASFLYVIFIEIVPLENTDSSKLSIESIRSGHCPSNRLTTPFEKFLCFSFALSGFVLVAGLQLLHHHHRHQ